MTTTARPRNHASRKAAGTRFAQSIAAYLATHYDDRVERRAQSGAKDRGDIGGVRLSPALRGGRIVLECKDRAKLALAVWHREAVIEAGNDDAVAGLVVHKRHGVGDPGQQWVTMTVADLVTLLTGQRPDVDEEGAA